MSSTTLLSTHRLTKNYQGVPALSELTLEVPVGSIGLLGENGAGKTTLIKLLLGLLHPSSGSAQVLGLDVGQQGLELRRRMGYMPEDDCLPSDLSALDLVVRMGQLSGLPRQSAVQRAHDMLQLVGLEEARYRSMGGYSMGMKQRVKLAQALVHDPKLVLLDEPTSGMDPQGREEMLELIHNVRKKMGISLLLSSHLLPDVERVCDYVVILRAGQVVTHGPLKELLGGLGKGLMLRVVGNREAFLEGLRRQGLDVKVLGTELLVESSNEDAYDKILRQAVETRVQLRRLQRETRSLEELFLALHAREP